jgi:hypothetical protein
MKKISILFYGISKPIIEHDYIVKDIFMDYSVTCDYILANKEEVNRKYDIFVYNCRNPNCKTHFGFAPSYEQVKNAILRFEPKVVIQLSDECWRERNDVHNLLGNFCGLFLRQYRHHCHLALYTKNTVQIPLGYLNGFYDRSVEVKKIKDRKYTWSWVGYLKSDRREMINIFWKMWNNITICNSNVPANEVFDIFSNSIFVPCGRGNFTLDCFRNYEATIAGAIPVVVGSQEEINCAYKYEEAPPWIYANNWAEAVVKCQKIQFDFNRLQEMQEANIAWWNRTIDSIRNKISDALRDEKSDYSSLLVKNLQEKILEQESIIQKPISIVRYS